MFSANSIGVRQQVFQRNRKLKILVWVLIQLLSKSWVMNFLLYNGDFPKNNSKIESVEIYRDIFRKIFIENSPRESFFAQLLLLGRIKYEEGLPLEANAEIYELMKTGILGCNIQLKQNDFIEMITSLELSSIDFASLSDVPSFLPSALQKHNFMQNLSHKLKDNALVVYRWHLHDPKPDTTGFKDVTDNFKDIISSEKTCLWTIKVYEYTKNI